MTIAAAMAENPEGSLPQQAQGWSRTMATYRFLHNERVTPGAIQRGAIERTRVACEAAPVTLLLHDLTEFKPVHVLSETKLFQHTALAVAPGAGGAIFGVMHQRWFDDPAAPAGETRRQRRGRWTRSDAWPEAVEAVGEPSGEGRWLHVADREADSFAMFEACEATGQGFVIRSQHNRYLDDGTQLRETLAEQPVAGGFRVAVSRRRAAGVEVPPRRRRDAQPGRVARCELRHASVTLAPPGNDPRYKKGRTVHAVWVREVNPPAEAKGGLDWLLLSSEPVSDLAGAMRVVEWYRRRWLIEELHKAQKTGCRLERTRLEDREAFIRLAAITGPVAARLLQLRECADEPAAEHTPAIEHVDDPLWVRVVSRLANHEDPATLTVKRFYHTIARLGGWLGRKHDGRPGWQSLWRGFQYVAARVEGARLAADLPQNP